MGKPKIVKADKASEVVRGDGVVSRLLIGKDNSDVAGFTAGFTTFPAGRNAPWHSHNCEEVVTIIDGRARVEVEGEPHVEVGKHDATFIPPGLSHRFVNIGDGPLMIHWVYGATHVTRTFTETGRTVEHLSNQDVVKPV
jgi:quercetin dioxygenase-like cupin family protein